MTDISSQTLHIVAKELAATLNDARASLEAYAERSDQRVLLEKCADQLHSAHGVLRLVEVYGAALLAEEMEHVTRYLLSSDNDQKRQVDGLDALMRAMVQLPTYLERVLSGGRDLALVLLPLLNDLRSVRGSPLLSEGTLLLLNLKSDQPAQPQSQRLGELTITVAQWARRLRPRFQIGLLGYIRGERTVQNLEILSKVAEKLEQVATTQPVFQLWWVVGAILEALRANGLEGSATLKRLLGQADRQIKALYELGEGRYCEDPPVDLLNNLLYYVARASNSGGRIAAVRASFKLSELLPVDDSIEHERESLSAPSVKLMRTVAAAIKEDLSKVKDVLDIFVRRGGGHSEELAPQLELLKKISDTLGVLGLGELRQRVQEEIAELSAMVSDGKPPSEESLIKVAGVLLSVEDSLDDQLVRLILPAAAEGSAADLPPDQDLEFRLVSEAVLRECIVNMARIKEAVSIAVQKQGDFPPQGLDNVPQLLRGITAGLLDAGQGPGGGIDGCDRYAGAQAHRTRGAGAGRHPLGEGRRRHRQYRVLHGNAAERAHRSLVHAGQRRNLHQDAGGRGSVAGPEHQRLGRRRRQDRQARSGRNDRTGAHQTRPRGNQSVDCRSRAGAGRPAIRRAVHRGSQGRDRVDSAQLPAMGPESNGFGVIGNHAPQLSHLEGQRTHGRRPGDRGIRLVDREFAESHHRQDLVAHARNDDAAAQRASPPCRNWWSSWKPGGTTRCRPRR